MGEEQTSLKGTEEVELTRLQMERGLEGEGEIPDDSHELREEYRRKSKFNGEDNVFPFGSVKVKCSWGSQLAKLSSWKYGKYGKYGLQLKKKIVL